jgi:GT2 family glycosyltransferase
VAAYTRSNDGGSIRPSTIAVIVHWGELAPTVSLVQRLSDRTGIDRIVVVANDLQPRPAHLVASATWLLPPRNLGFAGGFDYGYRAQPGADFYLLLNNDVDVDEACIAECQRVLTDPTIGIVAPVLVNSRGLQSGVGRVKRPLIVSNARNYPTLEPACDAEWVTGAVMFIRASCYYDAGFDLSYFLLWEDVDLCFRVRSKGWRVAVASRARAWHQKGGTNWANANANYYSARNRLWFSRRWGNPVHTTLVWLWIASMIVPRLLLADCLKGKGLNNTRSSIRGLADGLMNLPSGSAPLPDEPRPAKWLRR